MPVWATVLMVVAAFGGFIVTVVALYTKGTYWLGGRFDRLEHTLETHATTLSEHSTRMTTTENRFVELVADMQRLIGRSEIESERRWSGADRRGNQR